MLRSVVNIGVETKYTAGDLDKGAINYGALESAPAAATTTRCKFKIEDPSLVPGRLHFVREDAQAIHMMLPEAVSYGNGDGKQLVGGGDDEDEKSAGPLTGGPSLACWS